MSKALSALSRETLGLWLGVLGVATFAVTLPMTRLATGSVDAPQLSPWFVTFGRVALAGLLSSAFLLLTRSKRPARAQWKPLGLAVLGNAIGFPLLLAYALLRVNASHAAVIMALLPLATAAIAAAVLHQRASLGFWLCAVPLLGERLDAMTLGFALAVVATVFLGKRLGSLPGRQRPALADSRNDLTTGALKRPTIGEKP